MRYEIEYRGYTIARDEYRIVGDWRAYPTDYYGKNIFFGKTVDEVIVRIDEELEE